MSDCRNSGGRWPPLEIMRRAKEVDDTGLIPFVDTEAAARYLALSPHSLECYRSLGGGRHSTSLASLCATRFKTSKHGLWNAGMDVRPVIARASIEDRPPSIMVGRADFRHRRKIMFEPLPPETVALQLLLADLHDDLPGRVGRLRLLLAFEADFGQGRGLMLPGGTPAHFAYTEVRQAFVQGNFLSVILLSQCVLENVLAAEVGLLSLSNEIKGADPVRLKGRPGFRETIAAARAAGILAEEDETDLLRLANLRNALTHFRTVEDPSHIDRRSLSERRAAIEICEEDARFAIFLFVRTLAKSQFRFEVDPD